MHVATFATRLQNEMRQAVSFPRDPAQRLLNRLTNFIAPNGAQSDGAFHERSDVTKNGCSGRICENRCAFS